MGTKNVSLPPDLEAYVEAKVASGEYAHFSEVVRDGLRLLMQRELEDFEALRAEVQKGIDSARNEPPVELTHDEVSLILAEALAAVEKRRGK